MITRIGFTMLYFVYTILILFAGLLILGCGGSSNPAAEEDPQAQTEVGEKSLKVDIEVDNQTVKAGEPVQLTAKVQSPPPSAKILYSWAIVDGGGDLGENTTQSIVVFSTRSSVRPGEGKISIIQVTVTLISQQFSGNGSKTRISKEIQSVARTIPITVVGA